MTTHAPDKLSTIVSFPPTPKRQSQANIAADESGRAIVALLQQGSRDGEG